MNTNNPDNDYRPTTCEITVQIPLKRTYEAHKNNLVCQRQPANFTIYGTPTHEYLMTQTYDMFEEGIEWIHEFDEDGKFIAAVYA